MDTCRKKKNRDLLPNKFYEMRTWLQIGIFLLTWFLFFFFLNFLKGLNSSCEFEKLNQFLLKLYRIFKAACIKYLKVFCGILHYTPYFQKEKIRKTLKRKDYYQQRYIFAARSYLFIAFIMNRRRVYLQMDSQLFTLITLLCLMLKNILLSKK